MIVPCKAGGARGQHPARVFHTQCDFPGGPLINTPLQRGVGSRSRSVNRFNGLRRAGQTVETVPRHSRPRNTPLKRGVNESHAHALRRPCTTISQNLCKPRGLPRARAECPVWACGNAKPVENRRSVLVAALPRCALSGPVPFGAADKESSAGTQDPLASSVPPCLCG